MTHVGALTLLKTYKRNTSAIEEIDISVSICSLSLTGPLAVKSLIAWLRPVCSGTWSLHAAASKVQTQRESPLHRPQLRLQEPVGFQDL